MPNLDTYNLEFFSIQIIESSKSAKEIIPFIHNLILPDSVIDIGCGVGAWLNEYQKFANVTVTGVDGDYVEQSKMLIDNENFITANLDQSIPSVLKKSDLLICLEVAEHLSNLRAKSFVYELTKFSDVILFSAAVPGQEGTLHINEQFLSYWIQLFNSNDFLCYDIIRPKIWNNENVVWWYRQNIVLFVKKGNNIEEKLKKMESFHGFDLIQKDLLIHKTNKYNNSNAEISKLLKNPLFYLRSILNGLVKKIK